MPLPTPKSLATFMSDFLQNWAIVTGVSNVSMIPATDPIVAIAGSNSGAALYLQSLVFQLEALSRASTSVGPDLDSWFAQFSYTDSSGNFHGFTRPQGVPASVTITATINASGGPVTIQAGTIFETQPLTIQPSSVPVIFQVATSQTTIVNSSGVVALLCFAVNPVTYTDASGNSQTGFALYNTIPAGSFVQQYSPISGVSTVTNPASPLSGTNNASDAVARIDFVSWLLSLSEGTYAALVAAIADVGSGLVNGQTFALYDYATAPAFAQPGQIAAVVIGPGSGQYPGSNSDNPTMDAIAQAMLATEAFGVVGVEFYAKQYQVTAAAVTFTYSQSQLTAANLTISGLEALMTGILQTQISASGGNLGQLLYFSTLVQLWKNITVTLPGGVVSGIVVDVNASTFSFSTAGVPSGGGTFTTDAVQPGSPSTRDLSGYLSLATSVIVNFTALAAP